MDVEAVDLARLARGERLERADERSLFSASDSDGTQRGHRKHKRRAEQPSQKDAAGQSHDPGVHGRGKAKDQWNQESIDHSQNAEKNQPQRLQPHPQRQGERQDHVNRG